LGVCDDFLCASLWGNLPHDYYFCPSFGALGGLLVLRDTVEVKVWSSVSFNHVLIIHGRFIISNEKFYLFNMYAPCDNSAKQMLWDSLMGRLQLLDGKKVCVCGFFNVVRYEEERQYVRQGFMSFDHSPLNQFIEDNGLVDLPMCDPHFTWYKGGGLSMSQIDRFLLSKEWCLVWPNCLQIAQLRGLSNHCPLLMSLDEENWGPRPLRMLKCWQDMLDYKQFVISKWKSLHIDGWGGFVLKENLKMIKMALKDWHVSHSKNVPSKIDSLKARLSVCDCKGEDEVLTADEVAELHGTLDIHSLSRVNTSICWQQSRLLWLREGDANFKYFHSVLSSLRRKNTLSSLIVDGLRVEGMQPIRQVVFSHFSSHFRACNRDRSMVDDLQFQTLSITEGGSLVKPFSVEEVKAAVWDCESYKSHGPVELTLAF